MSDIYCKYIIYVDMRKPRLPVVLHAIVWWDIKQSMPTMHILSLLDPELGNLILYNLYVYLLLYITIMYIII